MSLPRPKRLYRVTKPNEEPQALQSQHAPYVTSYTSFFSLVFELDVHLFSDSFHSKLWPARAGEGGTFSVKHFKLQFDDLGFDQTSAYDDGRPMRGGRITRGHRVITKHISVEDSEIPSPADDHDDEYVKATSLKPLVQELRILAHPPLRDHSNIVDFLGVAWEKHLDHIGRPWPILVLEYASGGNLREFLNPDPSAMPWSITLSIAQQIACGLSALHDCGVIHGDLKPDNVLIVIENDGRPIAKVSDFGFAIIKSDYAELESSVPPRVRLTGFTPSWEAPEARQGTILLDQAHMIDVYAFGLIFAVMAMGGGNPLGINGNALSLEEIQALQDSGEVAAAAMDNIRRRMHSTEQIRLISNVLHATLVSEPALRPSLSSVTQDLIADVSGQLSDAEKVKCEEFSDLIAVCSSQGSSTELGLNLDSEVPRPFHNATVWEQGLFEPDAENLDKLLSMPLSVQKMIHKELEKAASRDKAAREPYVRSDGGDVPYLLCAVLLEGLGGTENLEEALTWLVNSAKAGCARARLDLPRILSAYKLDLPLDIQPLVPDWVAREVLVSQDRFACDTLERLDPSLLATTIEERERAWRLCTTTSDLWGLDWFEGLFTACLEFYQFIHPMESECPLDICSLGSYTVSQATAEPDRFLDFLLDPSIEHGEERATRDYGIGLGWIHFLANFGMVGILRRLLDNLRIDIDKSDVRGRTPLYFATICGNCPMVEFLLQKGAQASFGRDETGYTCLHLVTSFRRIDIPRMVQGLVKAGADIDASNKRGATPLHTALMQTGSRTSNFCATQALLENGADPCIKDNDGEMPYYWAVVLHQPEALKLLLKTCIERLSESDMITLKVNLFEHLTLVPRVDIVSFAGSGFPQSLDKIVQLLLDRPTLEAYKNHPDNGGDSALFRASGRGKLELMRSMCRCCPFVDVNEGEIEYNRPAIQYAIRHNKPAVVETLFSLGANIFYRDSLGENALHVAASYAPELVDLILELSKTRGVLEEMIASISVDGLTPLDKSIMAENLDTAQKLIDAGANWEQFRCVNQKEGKTTTLGQILSMPSPSLEQVTFLLLRNASCVVTENGSTAFHALATRSQDIRDDISTEFDGDISRLQIFDVLYSTYPDSVHKVDARGCTPLHLASGNVLADLVVRLCTAGVNPNSKDDEGMTALDRLYSRKASQQFEPQDLLLSRSFRIEIDKIEKCLRQKMQEVA